MGSPTDREDKVYGRCVSVSWPEGQTTVLNLSEQRHQPFTPLLDYCDVSGALDHAHT